MTSDVSTIREGRIPWRLAWGLIPAILLLPLIGGAPWTASDHVIMGVMLASVGLGIELLVRQSGSTPYRLGAVLAVIAAFLTVWVNLAVGMIRSEDNLYNMWFFGVLILAMLGAAIARLRPAGMMWAMGTAAVAQASAGLIGMSADLRGGIFSTAFGFLWLLSAVLFWGASRGDTEITG